MKLRTLLTILWTVMLTVQVQPQSSTYIQDAPRARAVALWEEMVRAKGGRERLHNVENLLIVSKIKVEAPRALDIMETRRLYALPDRAWLRAAFADTAELEAVIFSI